MYLKKERKGLLMEHDMELHWHGPGRICWDAVQSDALKEHRLIKTTIGYSMEGSFLQLGKGMHDMPCGTKTMSCHVAWYHVMFFLALAVRSLSAAFLESWMMSTSAVWDDGA